MMFIIRMRAMTKHTTIMQRFLCAGVLVALFTNAAMAAEIQSLAWETNDVLRVGTSGPTDFKVETLEQGQRLRVVFPQSSLGSSLTELPGQGIVKGVYPYLAENGTAVNLDMLLTEAGSLEVQPTQGGYRIVTRTASAAAQSASVSTPARAQNAVQEILYAKLPGDRIQVTVRLAQPPSDPSAFTITNPARISLDFPNTRVDLEKKTVNVRVGALASITAVGVEDRTRLVFSLVKPVAYRTAVDGNNFVVTLDAPSVATVAESPRVTHFASSKKEGKFSIKGIDFRRGSQGDGKVIINLSDPAVGIDVREQAGEVILDFIDTSVPAELQRRLDVVDFSTPVQTIDTFAQGKNTRMIISPKGKYEQSAYQTGDVFTVSIKPVIERPDEKKVDEFGYSGEKLSLNFQNIEVRAALQVLADFTGLNFVISDTVRGSLTLRLKDVPWDQALDLIVDAKGLAVRRKGNVLTVAPAAEVAAKEKAAFESAKSNIELEPLVSELIQINYAKADDIANLLKSIKQVTTTAYHPVFGPGGSGDTAGLQSTQASQSNTLLSPRGQVTVDARTNSLLIQDTPGKIREVRKLISELDHPVRQVMVESRLVEATDNYARSLGSRLGHLSSRTKGSTTTTTTGQYTALEPYYNSNTYTWPDVFNVNLPSGGVGGFSPGAFTLSFLKGAYELDLELSALEQGSRGKVISSPRVITANQKKAIIEQGQEQAIATTVLGVGGVVTKKATLKLEVTPQITPDDRVNLDVVVTKDNFVTTGANPTLNVKQIQTQVLLDNGETVVIGGIFEHTQNDTATQIPFFGDIPLLGWLFKNKDIRDNKTELLIFLTPRILSSAVGLR
jgi:type IV pilus assembly protein PilQ